MHVCVCVCVCVRERERERESLYPHKKMNSQRTEGEREKIIIPTQKGDELTKRTIQ